MGAAGHTSNHSHAVCMSRAANKTDCHLSSSAAPGLAACPTAVAGTPYLAPGLDEELEDGVGKESTCAVHGTRPVAQPQ